jgi:hypothetical protein
MEAAHGRFSYRGHDSTVQQALQRSRRLFWALVKGHLAIAEAGPYLAV